MICNAKPYEGPEAFLFISYCRKDAGIVYPLIERLAYAGVRVWYDSGIHGGDIWPEVIADHLNRSSACLVFMSQNAVESHNCFNELIFAVENKKPLVTVRYNDARLTMGMRLMIGAVQWIDIRGIPVDSDVNMILSLEPVRATMGYPDRSFQIQNYEINAGTGAAGQQKPVFHKPIQTEPIEEPAPAPTPEPKPAPVVQPAPAVQPAPEPKPAPAPMVQPVPASQPVPAVQPVPAPQPAPAVQPAPAPVVQPAPAPVVQPAPAPRPAPAVQQVPAPKPVPAPEPKPVQGQGYDSVLPGERIIPPEMTEDEEDARDKTVAEIDPDLLDGKTVASYEEAPPIIVVLRESGIRYRGKTGATIVGRSKTKADIAIDDPERKISGEHIKIICIDGKHLIEDMNSTNGTWVNGDALEKNQQVNVGNLCEVLMYRQKVLIAFDKEAETLSKADILLCLKCRETEETKYLWHGELRMGRNNPWKNGVLQESKVSHNHAMIRIDGSDCMLRDQNSTNGTEVNGVMLEKGGSCVLNTGDVIRIDVNHFEVTLIQLTQAE